MLQHTTKGTTMKAMIKQVTSDLNTTLKFLDLAGAEHDWSRDEVSKLAGCLVTLNMSGIGITDSLRFVYQNGLLPTKTQQEMFALVRTTRKLKAA